MSMKKLFWSVVCRREGLRRFVNGIICRLGRYHQYSPGICGWCGKMHVKPRYTPGSDAWARHHGITPNPAQIYDGSTAKREVHHGE